MNKYRLIRNLKAPFVYIHNRWVNPCDRVIIHHPGVQKGHYYDSDHVMLHVMFQMIVDFVEIECAVFPVGNSHFETRGQAINRWFRELPFLRWFVMPPRNARRGLYHLRWAMGLKQEHPSQAQFARDIFTLYRFWIHDRPARKDPFSAYSALREGKSWKGPLTPKERKALKAAQKLEDKYEKQDERMLHLIVKQRTGLWT